MRRYQDHDEPEIIDTFTNRWNKQVRSLRITGICVASVMVCLGILLCIFPTQSVNVITVLGALFIIGLGIYELVEYFSLPVMLQRGGLILGSFLNIILGILLLTSPRDISLDAFALMFGFLLAGFGMDLLAFSQKLGYLGITGYGWLVLTGWLSLIASMAFFLLPLASVITLNYLAAIYLIVGGIATLIEVSSMQDLKITN